MGNGNNNSITWCWYLFILIFFILLLIWIFVTPSTITTTTAVVGAAPVVTASYYAPPQGRQCRVCDISRGENYIYGAACCPILHTVDQVQQPALAAIPPPNLPQAVPHPNVNVLGIATPTASTCGVGRPCAGASPTLEFQRQVVSNNISPVPPPRIAQIHVDNPVTGQSTTATLTRVADVATASSGFNVLSVQRDGDPTRHIVAIENQGSHSVGLGSHGQVLASIPSQQQQSGAPPCDPHMPCSKAEAAPVAPIVSRISVPRDFFLATYKLDQVRCNDIQFANHCMYPGKFAFLRSPSHRFEDYGLDGVYGGKYCQAQCEPRLDASGNKCCVCVCTIAPDPRRTNTVLHT